MIASDPGQGGATWAVLQYVLGLRALGFDVWFVEPVSHQAVCPAGSSLSDSTNATYFNRVIADFGLAGRSAMLLAGTTETTGISYEQLQQVARRAKALLNISGLLVDETLTASIPIRIYLDVDPAFTQLWSAVQGIDMRFSNHTHHVTFGQSIGNPNCPIPECGLKWLKTLPPILLDQWPMATRIDYDALTTIGNWRGYGSVEHQGVTYGQKAHSLRPFYSLPELTEMKFMPALAIHRDETRDLTALEHHGWQLLDPSQVADEPASYKRFVQGSLAEFGIAKSGYVASQCGWFSDRSVCYLASGRPVLAQETGFSHYLPTGEGLFRFSTINDVLYAIDQLKNDYPRHSRAARAIAEEYFDSSKVLNQLLDSAGVG
jgi:hypothetical protein